jgi:CHAD domain-containing protein
MLTEIPTEVPAVNEPAGLDFWMRNVLTDCDRIGQNLEPDPVHNLRVALRRCRSIADGFMAFDEHPAWKLMKRESRILFQQLGALRDTHVMMEWAERIPPVRDDASFALRKYLEDQEAGLKEDASEAVVEFNQKKWASWGRTLSARARHIPLESAVFQHLALERLTAVRELHGQALRNRSQLSYHRLRIALKKFRYTVENFLPARHARWGAELREMQDLLGEMHDLDVLWRTAVATGAFGSEQTRLEWRRRVSEETEVRIEKYRAKTLGRNSLFVLWGSELPDSGEVYSAALARFRTWALYHDPDSPHSENVARLATQIYDGLEPLNLVDLSELTDARAILESAALAHTVGIQAAEKRHQRESYRLIRRLDPPLGLTVETLHRIALVVRFHRGALPRLEQKAWSGIPDPQRKALVLLSGILRLADAVGRSLRRHGHRLEVKHSGSALVITVPGYVETNASAEKLAAARHLLEVTCRLPILIR